MLEKTALKLHGQQLCVDTKMQLVLGLWNENIGRQFETKAKLQVLGHFFLKNSSPFKISRVSDLLLLLLFHDNHEHLWIHTIRTPMAPGTMVIIICHQHQIHQPARMKPLPLQRPGH